MIQTYANTLTGEVIERECAPMDRLEPIVEGGATYQPVTHDPKRWRWYDCIVPGTTEKPRLFYREDGNHRPELHCGVGSDQEKPRYQGLEVPMIVPFKLRPLPEGLPAMTIEPSMVPVHNGLPVSQSLPRIPTDPVSCREENFNGKTAFRHKDGRLTTAGGQQILESNRAVKQAAERAGYRFDKNAHAGE